MQSWVDLSVLRVFSCSAQSTLRNLCDSSFSESNHTIALSPYKFGTGPIPLASLCNSITTPQNKFRLKGSAYAVLYAPNQDPRDPLATQTRGHTREFLVSSPKDWLHVNFFPLDRGQFGAVGSPDNGGAHSTISDITGYSATFFPRGAHVEGKIHPPTSPPSSTDTTR